MKIRNGFISNSSSTSFVIYTKEPLTQKLLLGKLSVYFKILQGTWMFHKILSEAVRVFVYGAEEEKLIDNPHGYLYKYTGESTALNQDDWANIEDRVINTEIRIYQDDFKMLSDDDY